MFHACAVRERSSSSEKQQQSQQYATKTRWSSETSQLTSYHKTNQIPPAAISKGAVYIDGGEPMNLASQSGDAGGSQLLFANFNQDNT